jgi:hypothetical protein
LSSPLTTPTHLSPSGELTWSDLFPIATHPFYIQRVKGNTRNKSANTTESSVLKSVPKDDLYRKRIKEESQKNHEIYLSMAGSGRILTLNPEETEPWRTINSAIAGLLQSRSIKLPTLTGASQGPQCFTNLQWIFLQAQEITEKGKGNQGKIIQLLRLNQMLNSEDVTVDALERMSISNPCRGERPVGGALHLLVIGMSSPLWF